MSTNLIAIHVNGYAFFLMFIALFKLPVRHLNCFRMHVIINSKLMEFVLPQFELKFIKTNILVAKGDKEM
jgi:hypothetical protein